MLPKSWEIGFGWFPYSSPSLSALHGPFFLHGSLQQLGVGGQILPRTRPLLAPTCPSPSDHLFSISSYGHSNRADPDLSPARKRKRMLGKSSCSWDLKSSFQGLLSALALTPLPPNSVDDKTEVPAETEAGGRA